MKLTCLFALALTAAAQYGAAADTEQASGYSEQAESYGQDHFQYVSPKCCVSFCPPSAPFFSRESCACHAGIQTYDEPQYGESSGYRNLQIAPDNTIDTRKNVISRAGKIVLWVVFGIFFILAAYYIKMYQWYTSVAEGAEGPVLKGVNDAVLNNSVLYFLANPSLIAGIVCFVASLAYLTMATGNGWYARCDGRMFFFARYIDWVITTPLMLHALCHFANATDDTWNFLCFCDILMIVTGLIASTISGGLKWLFFAFSMLAFIPVLYYICSLRDSTLDNTPYDYKTGVVVKYDHANATYLPYLWFYGNYDLLANLTVLAWFLYPVVWILAEGTGTVSVTGEAIWYAVLDLIAKGIFGWFITHAEFRGPKQILAGGNLLKDKSNPLWK
jgi:bacteriorhodopsin